MILQLKLAREEHGLPCKEAAGRVQLWLVVEPSGLLHFSLTFWPGAEVVVVVMIACW